MAALESRVREREREGGIPLERPEVTQEEGAAYQLATLQFSSFIETSSHSRVSEGEPLS